MTTAAWILLGVAAVAAVTDWVAVARGRAAVEYVAKPLTMAALVGVAVVLNPADPVRQQWFVAAGLLCLAGDVCLMLPRDMFLGGVVAFLLGHLGYIGGLLRGEPSVVGLVAGLAVAALAVALVGRPVLRAIRRQDAEPFAPVVVYLIVISAMVVAAFAVGPLMAAAGALLFYVSDGVLALDRWVHKSSWAPVAVMVTYHLGQAGLMLSLVRAA